MNEKQTETIVSIYNWVRLVVAVTIVLFLCVGVVHAEGKSEYIPQVHGILRG